MRAFLKSFFDHKVLALGVSSLSALALVGSSLVTTRLGVKNLDFAELQLWLLMLAAIPFFMLLDLGAYSLLPGKFSYYSNGPKDHKLDEYTTTYLLTASGVIVGGALLIVLVASFQGGRWIPEDKRGLFVIIFILAIIARVIQNVLLGLIFAAGHIAYEKTLKTIGSLASVLPLAFFLENDLSVLSLPLSWLLSSVIVMSVAAFYIENNIAKIFDFSLFSMSISRSIFKTSIKFLAAALPGMFVYNVLPYRVAHDFGPEYTVQISIMMQISLGVTMVCGIPTSLYVRKIADEYFSEVDRPHGKMSLMRNVRTVSTISSAILLFFYLFRDFIINTWLGKQIAVDNGFFLIFLLVIWFEVQQTTMTTSLVSTGYVNFLRVNLMSAVFTLAGYSMLINLIGFSGVALACLFAQLVTCHYWNIRKTLDVFHLSWVAYLKQHLYSFVLMILVVLAVWLI